MAEHVAHPLLGRPVQEAGHRRGDGIVQGGVVQARAQAGRLGPGHQVADRRGETLLAQAGRIEVDHERAQRAHAVAHRGRGGLQLAAVEGAALVPGRGGQGVADAGEVLDHAVVEVAGDLAALDVGCVERPLQQRLPLPQSGAQAARQRPGQGDLDELEHHEGAQGDRGEAAPELGAAGRHGVVAVVGLEEEGLTALGVDGQVHLEQLVLVALEAVLGRGQVAHLGLDPAGGEGGLLVVAQVVARPDEPGLVGVDDETVGGPDLDPDERGVEDLLSHQRVEGPDQAGGLVAVEQRVVESGLDHALGLDQGRGAGVGDRLALADAPAGDRRGQRDQAEGQQPGEGELAHLGGHQPAGGPLPSSLVGEVQRHCRAVPPGPRTGAGAAGAAYRRRSPPALVRRRARGTARLGGRAVVAGAGVRR